MDNYSFLAKEAAFSNKRHYNMSFFIMAFLNFKFFCYLLKLVEY